MASELDSRNACCLDRSMFMMGKTFVSLRHPTALMQLVMLDPQRRRM